MELLSRIADSLVNGDDQTAADLTRQALDQGLTARQILDQGLLAGMQVVGRQFKEHEVFLPEVLLAARAMYAGLALLKPLLVQDDIPAKGKVVLGTVKGDLHDIGKNLVVIMLRGAGYEVIDLGSDVPPQRFIDAAVQEGAQVIGLSALLTTTMIMMKQVADLLAERGLKGKIKLIVGGAPVSGDFARSIGADGYGYDANKAVELVDSILAEAARHSSGGT